ncbi:MAG TPA: Rv3235 family protein [Nitriliruptorales bacterium]|jgi:hypothetical protein
MFALEPVSSPKARTHPAACPSVAGSPGPTSETGSGGRQPEPVTVLPTLARLVMEVLAGRRPLGQIAPLLSPAVAARLADRVRGQYRSGEAPSDRVRVRHAASCWVSPAACEGVVTVQHADRTTALAIRIERHDGRWRVAEIAGPEFAWRPIGPRRRHDDLAELVPERWATPTGSA